jgi:hypothetical protein
MHKIINERVDISKPHRLLYPPARNSRYTFNLCTLFLSYKTKQRQAPFIHRTITDWSMHSQIIVKSTTFTFQNAVSSIQCYLIKPVHRFIRGRNRLNFSGPWVHPQFLVGSVLLIVLVFCVLFVFVMCPVYPMLPVFLDCLCLVSCVPNVASISGLSILDCLFGFF